MVDKEYLRKKYFIEGWSIRRISRNLDVARQTVRKALKDSNIPQYNLTKDRPSPAPCVSIVVIDLRRSITVVSGFAKGIDSYAHTACLKAVGYTLAFVANGVDICRQEYFPHRNKLLAAWADKLLVVETAERSGALITAEYAKECGRNNSIYSLESRRANRRPECFA